MHSSALLLLLHAAAAAPCQRALEPRVNWAAFAQRPAPPPQTPVLPEVVEHGPREAKRIALTFDACSAKKGFVRFDERIERILEETGTPATLFVGGIWAQAEKGHFQRLARSPLFELANHSFTHRHLTRLSDDEVREEILRTQAEVFAQAGRVPAFFRAPFGELDQRVARIAASVGLTPVQWDVASGDPDRPPRARLVAWVLRKAQAGSIVVMHIHHRDFTTADALPEIIAGLRARGFELVTVGQLLRPPRRFELWSPEPPAFERAESWIPPDLVAAPGSVGPPLPLLGVGSSVEPQIPPASRAENDAGAEPTPQIASFLPPNGAGAEGD